MAVLEPTQQQKNEETRKVESRRANRAIWLILTLIAIFAIACYALQRSSAPAHSELPAYEQRIQNVCNGLNDLSGEKRNAVVHGIGQGAALVANNEQQLKTVIDDIDNCTPVN